MSTLVSAFLVGRALGWFLTSVYAPVAWPLLAIAVCGWVPRKFASGRTRPLVPAIAVQGGHQLLLLVGAVLTAKWLILIDVLPVAAGIVWLVRCPSLAPVALLLTVHIMEAAVGAARLWANKVEPGIQLWAEVHLSLRLASIILTVVGWQLVKQAAGERRGDVKAGFTSELGGYVPRPVSPVPRNEPSSARQWEGDILPANTDDFPSERVSAPRRRAIVAWSGFGAVVATVVLFAALRQRSPAIRVAGSAQFVSTLTPTPFVPVRMPAPTATPRMQPEQAVNLVARRTASGIGITVASFVGGAMPDNSWLYSYDGAVWLVGWAPRELRGRPWSELGTGVPVWSVRDSDGAIVPVTESARVIEEWLRSPASVIDAAKDAAAADQLGAAGSLRDAKNYAGALALLDATVSLGTTSYTGEAVQLRATVQAEATTAALVARATQSAQATSAAATQTARERRASATASAPTAQVAIVATSRAQTQTPRVTAVSPRPTIAPPGGGASQQSAQATSTAGLTTTARYELESRYISWATAADYPREQAVREARTLSEAQMSARIERFQLESRYISWATAAGRSWQEASAAAHQATDTELRAASR